MHTTATGSNMREAALAGPAAALSLPQAGSNRPPGWALRDSGRVRLTQRLLAIPPGGLALVRAPAGHGKTSALARLWRTAQAEGRRVAWLGVTKADGDPGHLLERIATAAGARASRADAGHRVGTTSAGSLECAARRFHALHEAQLRDCTLIIDGFEAIDGSASSSTIAALVACSEQTRFAIGGRQARALPTAAWRAQGRAIEFGPTDLAFRLEEARALSRAAVPDEYLAALLQRCDGIALAVDLAIRALAAPLVPFSSTAPDSWMDEVASYFREQVLRDLAPELRRLLGKLAIVEQFDVSLASALCGHEVGHRVRELYRDHALIARDRATGLFHLPAALRACLEGEHEWDAESELSRVHARAAEWFARRGLSHEAAMHALLSRDPSLATRYFDPVGPTTLGARYGMQPMYEALCAWPAIDGALASGLTLAQDMVYKQAGLSSEPRCELESPSEEIDSEQLITAAFVRGYRDELAAPAEVSGLRELALRQSVPDLAARGLARNLLCWDGLRSGRLDEAADWGDLAECDFLTTGSVYANAFIHLLRVPILIWQHDLAGASRQAELARTVARLFHPDDARLENLSLLMSSWVEHEQGVALPLDRSHELARELALGERWHDAITLGHVLAARCASGAGELDTARSILEMGIATAVNRRQSRVLWSLRCERVRLAVHSGDVRTAQLEAQRLGLSASGRMAETSAALTWREHVEGIDTCIRLAIAVADWSGARAGIDALRARHRAERLPRLEWLAHRAEAELATAEGDSRRAEQARAAAAAVSPRTRPAATVIGAELFSREPDLSTTGRLVAALQRPVASVTPTLTPRETALLELIAAGMSNKQIAWHSKLSEATVKFHIRNIYRKVGARNRVQALARLHVGSGGLRRSETAGGGSAVVELATRAEQPREVDRERREIAGRDRRE
jgi:ATP/maltotriose-dependent transcriptional regulator MalT